MDVDGIIADIVRKRAAHERRGGVGFEAFDARGTALEESPGPEARQEALDWFGIFAPLFYPDREETERSALIPRGFLGIPAAPPGQAMLNPRRFVTPRRRQFEFWVQQ